MAAFADRASKFELLYLVSRLTLADPVLDRAHVALSRKTANAGGRTR